MSNSDWFWYGSGALIGTSFGYRDASTYTLPVSLMFTALVMLTCFAAWKLAGYLFRRRRRKALEER